MTSLSNQLESLRTSAVRQLTVEKRHISLIFDKKEAKTLDRETVHKIGCAGLDQLRKLDDVFDSQTELFSEESLQFQRTLITREENEKLNDKIEKLLFYLSPYMQHFACQQVLEWLVFKYQIHSFNAEALMMSFMPFHETNFYGRILSVVEYNFSTSKDWGFMEGFGKKAYPVPFSALVKNTLSSTHSLLTRITDHINKGLQLVGEQFMETKSPVLFTFYAKLVLALLEQPEKLDDSLLAKIIPLIANGLKSSLASFRHASLMIICQMAISVKLAPSITSSLLKVLFMKLRPSSVSSSLSTAVVICQQQTVESFSNKAIIKILRNEVDLNIWANVKLLSEQTDLTAFVIPLWNSLFDVYAKESDTLLTSRAINGIISTTVPELMTSPQAMAFLTKIFDLQAAASEVLESKKIQKRVRPIVARFSKEFDTLCERWKEKDQKVLDAVIQQFELKDLVIMEPILPVKRPRQRSNSLRKSFTEEKFEDLNINEKATATQKAALMAKSSEFARRQVFSGDPLKKALDWIKKKDWENVGWALDEMSNRKSYFADKIEEDVEDFIIKMIKLVVDQTVGLDKSRVKGAIAEAEMNADFVEALLTRVEIEGSAAKKAKTVKEHSSIKKVFDGESNDEWERRLTFTLEMLSIKTNVPVNTKLLSILFDIVKQVEVATESQQMFYAQHLSITLLIKMLQNPGKYKVAASDLQMECVVDTMRNTHSHHVLRESLRLLTAAVRISPSSVTSHVMSVFTFMGSGLLRKDNELTLGIIEHTLEALFQAVVKDDGRKSHAAQQEMRQRLIGVTRVFAASASDIPAHRRTRMARAISKAVKHDNVWIVASVMLEGFCAKWQRTGLDANKKNQDQDAFEDIALEMVANMLPVQQLSVVLDLVQFCVRLGGDAAPAKMQIPLDISVFDRSKYSVPKLRHFRFVVVGLIAKVLSNRQLYEKLAAESDESLYESMLPVGKRLMTASVELDEFAAKETKTVEAGGDPQSERYWVAFTARAETVAEKLRHLLPGCVAARLIADVLEDDKTEARMREKALQLANIKLMHDGFFHSDSGINEEQLNRLAVILNKWIGPERASPEKILLCQNAAFSLKLVAKRIPRKSESAVLTETMQKCASTAAMFQTLDECMVGNVLLLAGELIRSHNMCSTMTSAKPLLKTCLSILSECINNHANAQKAAAEEARRAEEALNKRQRVRQQSLCGRKLGSDTLLICALTCTQRILDQFAPFVAESMSDVFVRYCRLSGRFFDGDSAPSSAANSQMGPAVTGGSNNPAVHVKGSIQHRLDLIKKAILRTEMRILPAHFASAVGQLATEEKPLCALMSLLGGFYDMSNRDIILLLKDQLMKDVYLKALEFRAIERKPETFENVGCVEKATFDSILSMAEVLSEKNLRPLIASLIQWAEPALMTSAEHSIRVRLIPLFHFANCFYKSFNSLALPHFGKIIEMAGKVLRGCNATNITDASLLLLTGRKDTVEGLETDLLIKQVIEFITNCARHKEYFTADRGEMVIDPLVEELVNTKLGGHEGRCVPYLAEALFRIADALPDTFQDLLNKVLLKTRSGRPKIRYRTLLVVEALLDRVGDGIAPHLPMVMPFLSELLEDENRNVEEQCERVVRLLQKKFGENIAEGFA